MRNNSNKKNSRKRCLAIKISTVLIILIIPFFIGLKIVETNKPELFTSNFLATKEMVLWFLTFFLIFNVIILIKNRELKLKNSSFATVFLFLMFIVLELTGSLKLVYYNDDFKDWLIKTSVGSINYKYVATSVYNEKTIAEVMDTSTREDFEELDDDIIEYTDLTYEKVHYKNEFEEQVLKHEEGEFYKIIPISGTTIGANYHYEGFMAVIYDPSRVTLAKSSGAGTSGNTYGETLSTIAKKSGAKVAMNAGGFYDPNWSSNGGIPHGPVIIDGKLQSEYARGFKSGGLIGFTKDNKLVLKRMSGQEALDYGIRDAVDWGPYLIVNGKNKFTQKNYVWAVARTAIGQRADGTVLLLVIDGLQEHSKGCYYNDLAAIMQKYGAVNAASLDGGTSTAMTVDGKYINKPWNGYVPTFRRIPNAWIVK